MKPRATVCVRCHGSGRILMVYANASMKAPVRCGACLGKGYMTPSQLRIRALHAAPAVAARLRAMADGIESRGPRATS